MDLATYRWRALDELALAAFYTQRYEEAATGWRTLLASAALPESERPRILANTAYLPESYRDFATNPAR